MVEWQGGWAEEGPWVLSSPSAPISHAAPFLLASCLSFPSTQLQGDILTEGGLVGLLVMGTGLILPQIQLLRDPALCPDPWGKSPGWVEGGGMGQACPSREEGPKSRRAGFQEGARGRQGWCLDTNARPGQGAGHWGTDGGLTSPVPSSPYLGPWILQVP